MMILEGGTLHNRSRWRWEDANVTERMAMIGNEEA